MFEAVARRPHVKPEVSVTVGGFVVGVVTELNIRYITSPAVLVVRAVAQVDVQAPWKSAVPSIASEEACAAGMEAPKTIANAKVAIIARPRTRFVPEASCPIEPVEVRNLNMRRLIETSPILGVILFKS